MPSASAYAILVEADCGRPNDLWVEIRRRMEARCRGELDEHARNAADDVTERLLRAAPRLIADWHRLPEEEREPLANAYLGKAVKYACIDARRKRDREPTHASEPLDEDGYLAPSVEADQEHEYDAKVYGTWAEQSRAEALKQLGGPRANLPWEQIFEDLERVRCGAVTVGKLAQQRGLEPNTVSRQLSRAWEAWLAHFTTLHAAAEGGQTEGVNEAFYCGVAMYIKQQLP